MSDRIRIIDIADELGVSTATVSNVIHGKTKKISDETVKRVQELLERKQYIPSMAGILLAQNDSKIIGVVINKHEKYEGHVLEDGFISSSLNYLSEEIEKAGYFMMVKVTEQWNEITRFASMWNMEGLVIIGFCEQDYRKIRENMHIPFVIYDGFFKEQGQFANITIDNFSGGFQMGHYLKQMGHRKVLCLSDNDICMDAERYQGLKTAMQRNEVHLMLIPDEKAERQKFYHEKISLIRQYTAIFAVSDYYALDIMHFLQEQGLRIPEDISVAGFDDIPLCRQAYPTLTTIRQDGEKRAESAIRLLMELKKGSTWGEPVVLPVQLVERDSVRRL
ncbi:MAG: LacI family transcriptional regulator [Lachnospiraceae bacterium]|nr:LacI family transcriptional regulator [Lachnospiraceae bacterium]